MEEPNDPLTPRALGLVLGLSLVLAVAVFRPWWTARTSTLIIREGGAVDGGADSWTGVEVLGHPLAWLLFGLAAATIVAAVASWRGQTPALVASVVGAAVGGGAIGGGVGAALRWGTGAASIPGSVLMAAVGVVVLVVALIGARGAPLAVGAGVVALVGFAVVVPHPPGRSVDGRDGPFVQLAHLADVPFRSGAVGLPTGDVGARLMVVEGHPAIGSRRGVVALSGDGRAEVLARFDLRHTSNRAATPGFVGGRLVHWAELGVLRATVLDPRRPEQATIRDVRDASPPSPDGQILLTGRVDHSATARPLDLASLPVDPLDAAVDADELPLLALPTNARVIDVVPGVGDVLFHPSDGRDGERRYFLEEGSVRPAVGGFDRTCGLVAGAVDAFLPGVTATAADPDGGWWLAVEDEDATRLVHLRDGVLRAVEHVVAGRVTDLTIDGERLVFIVQADGLWALPDAHAHLVELPDAGADCHARPDVGAEPADLIPAGGALLDGPAVPDGAGGTWSIESVEQDESPEGTDLVTVELVHESLDGAIERIGPVADIDAYSGLWLVPDLTGAPPLVATGSAALDLSGGQAVPVIDRRLHAGAIGADGVGWFVLEGGLSRWAGGRLVPVIDPGDADEPAPVSVQLARGIDLPRLRLQRAQLALDADSRPIVLSDDIVLAVTPAGEVVVLAQDERMLDASLHTSDSDALVLLPGEWLDPDDDVVMKLVAGGTSG